MHRKTLCRASAIRVSLWESDAVLWAIWVQRGIDQLEVQPGSIDEHFAESPGSELFAMGAISVLIIVERFCRVCPQARDLLMSVRNE